MPVKNKYTTVEAAKFLDISRQWFWILAKQYKLEPIEKYGKIKIYALKDLKDLSEVIANGN